MMARYAGGRPGSSRRVRLVPVRQSGMDHRAVARIVLALARQMAAEADEAVEPSAEQMSSRRPGALRAASSMSARHCMEERFPHCRHDGTHHSTHESATAGCSRFSSSDEVASASSVPGGAP